MAETAARRGVDEYQNDAMNVGGVHGGAAEAVRGEPGGLPPTSPSTTCARPPPLLHLADVLRLNVPVRHAAADDHRETMAEAMLRFERPADTDHMVAALCPAAACAPA
eukprot:TRINITY_DN20013_c0_g2_i2.p3 TRINITY_DN20013_c0_g2~~TRINITY_DN20013_c0_g2_i2.p3  ORF type:complete len:108 (-),score=2.92 TRINITY_DN20013_c0_g2_i2:61-384(-)